MTRGEAIEHLRNLSQANFYPRTIMALDMAIEALQNLSKPNNGLQGSDLIRRKDAIKQFGEDGTWLERQGITTLTMVEAKQRAVDILEALSSADRPTGECRTCGRNADNGGAYEDGRTKCPIQEHYALLLDGYCHLYEPYGCGAKMGGDNDVCIRNR